ncbi:MAG TPA: tripartite tricarboxylate transporter substrate binding protein [Burkholderiales bacterium]|jgi:tripartite-type tricarboxylate transporter receptor subunit TctC|nr:tripartite tricarboxylate transporter substrate binding protein [Burkholderiales bacterium]
MLTRKALLLCAALALALPALAQTYPTRPVRIVVPFAPGTATDNLVRPLADVMAASLKQPVVLDNRVGAVGKIAAEHVAKSPADGYTVLAGATTVIAANPALFKLLNYNPRTDFDAVIGLGTIPQVVVVHPSIPARNMAEFVAYAKQNPGKLFYASGTAGNIIPSRILSDRLGLGMTNVSYKSPPQALTDVVAGRVPMMAVDVSAVLGQIRGGAVRPLAVTSLKESPVLPGVPPLADTLPGFELIVFFGLYVPKGTDPGIIQTLYQAARAGAEREEFRRGLAGQGFEISTSSPAELAAFSAREIERWAQMVKEAKIDPE